MYLLRCQHLLIRRCLIFRILLQIYCCLVACVWPGLALTVSCNLPQSHTPIGRINSSWKSFLKSWSCDCLSLPRGSACSLREQDWSATAQPGGLNLVCQTRPPCLFLTAFFGSSLFFFFSFHFGFSPSLHLGICALPLIICVTNTSILFSPMHEHLVGYILCFTLPSKHSCRMSHYLQEKL